MQAKQRRHVGLQRARKLRQEGRAPTSAAPALPKLTVPRPTRLYPRARLFDLLDRARKDHRVIWVSAPGGAGKTSLAASYLSARKLPVLWYQVDAGDGDVASFFYYIGIAVRRAAPRYKKPLPLLTPEYLADIPTFTRNYFRELYRRLPDGAVMVLDNYQDAPEDSGLHDVLHIAMQEVPTDQNLLVLSRVEPPAVLARLRLCDHAACLDWGKMQLTAEETAGISAIHIADRQLDDETLSRLHERTQGWAAGLVLMLEQSRKGVAPDTANIPVGQQLLFDYFAREILVRSDPTVQEFLLKTALCPKISISVARALTDIERAREILEDLTRRNYFTVRNTAENEESYEYHPLFREFLLNEAGRRHSAETLREFQQRAADLLGDSGQVEAAADLLVRIGAVESLITLILRHAAAQLAQGRWQTLGQWLAAVPADFLNTNPWLLYWHASATMPNDLFAARATYHRAYLLFKAQHEVSGAYLAWSAVVESFMYLWIDFTPLDYWIDEMKDLRAQFPVYPSLEIEAHVACGMVGATLWRRVDTPMMREWAETAVSMLDKAIDVNTKLMMGNNALLYYLWWQGNLPMSRTMYSKMRALGENSSTSLLVRLSWKVMEAAYFYLNGRADAAITVAHQGLDLAKKSGIHHMNLLLYAQAVYGHLTRFEADGALQALQGMESLLHNTETFDFAHYHYLMTWTLLCQNQPSTALEHIRISVEAVNRMGASSYPAFSALTHAQVLYECGQATEAFVVMEPAREWGRRVGNGYVEIHYQLLRALHALDQNDAATCAASLAAALRTCKLHEFPTIPWLGWREPLLTRLLQQALILEIEPDYVCAFIRKRNLLPIKDSPVSDLWPFPVKLHTLGRFCVLVNDKRLTFSGKSQKKPMELLKALTAFGGRGVSEAQLTEALWPDAEGDAAAQSLATTLHRLRKLLGEEAIERQEGRLTLDVRRVWVDVWTFEQQMTALESVCRERKHEDVARLSDRMLNLYSGGFLPGETDAPWALAMRERLRSKCLRLLEIAVGCLQQGQQPALALVCYQKAIEIDPLAEGFHQGLMRCYHALGRRAEALATYERCRQLLSARFGIAPSPQTEALYRQILGA